MDWRITQLAMDRPAQGNAIVYQPDPVQTDVDRIVQQSKILRNLSNGQSLLLGSTRNYEKKREKDDGIELKALTRTLYR